MSAPARRRRSTPAAASAGAAVAVATALVIVGVAIALFFNPVWVSFAQGRADAAAWTGWTAEQVDAVTRDIVLEVWFGPGEFEQEVAGEPVFTERERSHMADVRGVVLGFYAVVLLGAATLAVAGFASRGVAVVLAGRRPRRQGPRRRDGRGRHGVPVFFDTAFTIFHQLLLRRGLVDVRPGDRPPRAALPTSSGRRPSVAIAVVGFGLTIAVWALAAASGAGTRPAPQRQRAVPAATSPDVARRLRRLALALRRLAARAGLVVIGWATRSGAWRS